MACFLTYATCIPCELLNFIVVRLNILPLRLHFCVSCLKSLPYPKDINMLMFYFDSFKVLLFTFKYVFLWNSFLCGG